MVHSLGKGCVWIDASLVRDLCVTRLEDILLEAGIYQILRN